MNNTREEDLQAPPLAIPWGKYRNPPLFDGKYSQVSEENFAPQPEPVRPAKRMKAVKGMIWKGRKWTGEGDPADPATWVPVDEKPAEQAAPERSTGQDLLRQLGLTARAGVTGALAIPGMLSDAPFQVANLMGADLPLPSQKQSELLTRLGLPEPEGAQERLVQDVAGGVAGTGAISGLAKAGANMTASPTAQSMLSKLAQNPRSQAIAGGVASGAGGAVREMGGGPAAQMAAGLATSARMPTRASNPAAMRAPGREVEYETFKEAQQEGIKVPPTRIETTRGREFLESLGGKDAIKQQITIDNQNAVNRVAKREAGLKPNQDLTESNLELARMEMTEPYRQAATLSPRAKQALEGMQQARAEAKLQHAHYQHTHLPEAKKQADALDEKAAAYERVIEREAGKVDMKLVPKIRAARVALAKNYQVERALIIGSGDVDPGVFGRELNKRGSKAVTGGLRTLGKAQQAFPPFMGARPKTPSPGVSHLDVYSAAGLTGLGASQFGLKGALAGLAWPTLRFGARKYALSPGMQKPISAGQGIPQAALLNFLAKQQQEQEP